MCTIHVDCNLHKYTHSYSALNVSTCVVSVRCAEARSENVVEGVYVNKKQIFL
jgi:hypothetical protein